MLTCAPSLCTGAVGRKLTITGEEPIHALDATSRNFGEAVMVCWWLARKRHRERRLRQRMDAGWHLDKAAGDWEIDMSDIK